MTVHVPQPNGTPVDANLASHKAAEWPLLVVDDLLRRAASESEQRSLLAYPKSEHGLLDYELFSAQELDRFVNQAAQIFIGFDLCLVTDSETPVVGLLGLSTLDYVINMWAISRLGYAVLILSPRLATDAYQSLLRATGCHTLVYASNFETTARKLAIQRRLRLILRSEYDRPGFTGVLPVHSYGPEAQDRVAFILHSSGSTGLPKPIHATHKTALDNYASGYGLKALLTAPMYHTHGLGCLYRTINMGGILYLYNPNHALTSTNLVSVMEAIRPKVVFAVPYALKMLAESRRGIEVLASCEVVSSSGSMCPDDLGNTLTKHGVHLESLYGASEFGQIMTSRRPHGDDSWDYMRLIPYVKPFVSMKAIDGNTFELVILDGLKSKNTSNSNDPPNSYHSSDIFTPHPTIKDAWKYIGRLDDRVTLVNGEKVLPLPIEGRIRQDPLVREAVVFGSGKDLPGLLCFRSDAARNLSNEDFITQIWPSVKDANSRAESFSQISRETIVPLDPDVEYPQTDKGTIIRAQVYRKFAREIEALYDSLEGGKEGGLVLEIPELQDYLMRMFRDTMELPLENPNSDFFAAGLDSLKAIRAVTIIKRNLSLGGHSVALTQDQLFQRQNVAGLADFLKHLRLGDTPFDPQEKDVQLMESLVKKYSRFTSHEPADSLATKGRVVVLTGATGSLGSHILAQLVRRPDVSQVYCLVRASPSADPLDRVLSSLKERYLSLREAEQHKIHVLQSDLRSPDLGIPANVFHQLQCLTSLVIHSAWAVNFNLGVKSFEDYYIHGTQNLLNFTLSVRRRKPARFVFCSSISGALGKTMDGPIPEAVVKDLADAQKTGYSQSKLVTEHIVGNARSTAGADICILRIGQIVGDTQIGLWNPSESIPLMISTAEKIGLPELDEQCSWLPVNTVAAGTIELGFKTLNSTSLDHSSESWPLLYNVVHPRPFSWSPDLLQALRDAGLKFEAVDPKTWVQRLQAGDQDPRRNPAVKLSTFWAERYNSDGVDGNKGLKVTFDTTLTERDSDALRLAPDLLKEGLITKFVQQWRKQWTQLGA